MQLSRYLKIFPSREEPGHLLFYSTKRASTILVEASIMQSIKEGTLSFPEERTLTRLGFLVPDVNEEKEEIITILDKTNKAMKRFNAVVVMSLDCNLACTYCYEGKMKGRHYMSSETADMLVDYFEKHAFSMGKQVHIDFYGGEPLLSYEQIKHISEKLKALAREREQEYSFNLVTNGTLLTGRRARELALLGLKDVRITIDGPRENHDQFRPFISGAGTFDLIFKNIREASDFIKIQLGGNFTRENYRRFPELLDDLLRNGIGPERFSVVKFDPVTKTRTEFGLPDFKEGCGSANEPWLFEAILHLREEILKRDFYTPKITPSPCMIELDDNIVVNFDGTLYKCPGLIGWKDMGVGNLRKGIKSYKKSHNLDLWKRPECLDCEYLPLCFGGCRYMKLLRDGNLDGVDCRKFYFDATLEAFIRQDVKYQLGVDNH